MREIVKVEKNNNKIRKSNSKAKNSSYSGGPVDLDTFLENLNKFLEVDIKAPYQGESSLTDLLVYQTELKPWSWEDYRNLKDFSDQEIETLEMKTESKIKGWDKRMKELSFSEKLDVYAKYNNMVIGFIPLEKDKIVSKEFL